MRKLLNQTDMSDVKISTVLSTTLWGLKSWSIRTLREWYTFILSFSCDESLRIGYELLFIFKYLRTIFFLCDLFSIHFSKYVSFLNNFKYCPILELWGQIICIPKITCINVMYSSLSTNLSDELLSYIHSNVLIHSCT